jgi:flagellum-specific ATP synthase
VLESLSRLMPEVTDETHRQAARTFRELEAAYRDHEDLISIGAYRQGSHAMVDVAMQTQNAIYTYLRQRVEEPSTLEEARNGLLLLHQAVELQRSQSAASPVAPQTATN